jgi:hypothetical protein
MLLTLSISRSQMLRLFKLLTLCVLFSTSVNAQSPKPGTWGLATLLLPSTVDHRLGGYLEAQFQSDGIPFKNIYYNEFKGGISYAIAENYTVLIGGGRYGTGDYNYVSAKNAFNEKRAWEQLSYTHNLGRLMFEHRYRVEQRWINSVFRSRFRYRLNLQLPINHSSIEPGTLYLSAFDEIFLGNQQFSWERNRMSAQLGFQFSPSVVLQAGWMNEDNNSVVNDLEKNNLLINIIYQFKRNHSPF